jgi:hypothetical protein
MTNFCLARTDRFDILLIKHDVGRPDRKIKNALPRCRHSVENAQKQPPLLPLLGRFLMGRKILDKDRNVLDTAAKFFRQRIQSFFSNADEIFACHPSPTGARARSLRVAVIILVIIAAFFAIAVIFPFVFFVVRLVANDDIGSYRAIRMVWVEVFWMYSAHVQWYAR